MYYFQFQIFISEINNIFGIFKIMLGAGSKVLVQETFAQNFYRLLHL